MKLFRELMNANNDSLASFERDIKLIFEDDDDPQTKPNQAGSTSSQPAPQTNNNDDDDDPKQVASPPTQTLNTPATVKASSANFDKFFIIDSNSEDKVDSLTFNADTYADFAAAGSNSLDTLAKLLDKVKADSRSDFNNMISYITDGRRTKIWQLLPDEISKLNSKTDIENYFSKLISANPAMFSKMLTIMASVKMIEMLNDAISKGDQNNLQRNPEAFKEYLINDKIFVTMDNSIVHCLLVSLIQPLINYIPKIHEALWTDGGSIIDRYDYIIKDSKLISKRNTWIKEFKELRNVTYKKRMSQITDINDSITNVNKELSVFMDLFKSRAVKIDVDGMIDDIKSVINVENNRMASDKSLAKFKELAKVFSKFQKDVEADKDDEDNNSLTKKLKDAITNKVDVNNLEKLKESLIGLYSLLKLYTSNDDTDSRYDAGIAKTLDAAAFKNKDQFLNAVTNKFLKLYRGAKKAYKYFVMADHQSSFKTVTFNDATSEFEMKNRAASVYIAEMLNNKQFIDMLHANFNSISIGEDFANFTNKAILPIIKIHNNICKSVYMIFNCIPEEDDFRKFSIFSGILDKSLATVLDKFGFPYTAAKIRNNMLIGDVKSQSVYIESLKNADNAEAQLKTLTSRSGIRSLVSSIKSYADVMANTPIDEATYNETLDKFNQLFEHRETLKFIIDCYVKSKKSTFYGGDRSKDLGIDDSVASDNEVKLINAFSKEYVNNKVFSRITVDYTQLDALKPKLKLISEACDIISNFLNARELVDSFSSNDSVVIELSPKLAFSESVINSLSSNKTFKHTVKTSDEQNNHLRTFATKHEYDSIINFFNNSGEATTAFNEIISSSDSSKMMYAEILVKNMVNSKSSGETAIDAITKVLFEKVKTGKNNSAGTLDIDDTNIFMPSVVLPLYFNTVSYQCLISLRMKLSLSIDKVKLDGDTIDVDYLLENIKDISVTNVQLLLSSFNERKIFNYRQMYDYVADAAGVNSNAFKNSSCILKVLFTQVAEKFEEFGKIQSSENEKENK